MKGTLQFRVVLEPDVAQNIVAPLELEAASAPEGGLLHVHFDLPYGSLVLEMASEDLSTLRAMLNSYLGLVSAAIGAVDHIKTK